MAACKDPILRYFDARGRAQFIRYYLRARDIAFVDERVPLDPGFAEWVRLKPDRAKTGPFQKLPVLHWGDDLVAETLVIADFLHRACGDAAALSAETNLRHDMLLSSLASELMQPIAMLIWADIIYPGVDVAEMTRRTVERLRSQLSILEMALEEWRWIETSAKRPVLLADCLLFEELDVVRKVFGESAGIESMPLLARHLAEAPGRDVFRACLDAAPCQITGRPNEVAALEVIRAALD
jgi:glutathione S-transferase